MKTKIIAEIAQGYEGDINITKRFVKLAKLCGADGIKFQIFEAEELCLPNYKYYDLFKSLYIEPEEWKKIIALCNDIGLEFYADIFGTTTLQWMLDAGISGIKIHSTDVKNYKLLTLLKDKNIRIILGVGGSTLEEIETAIKYLGKNEIIAMSGFQAEPNLIEDIELNKLSIIKERFKLPVGYADHIDVKTPLSKSLPAMAVLMGADYIEKHLTIERDFLQIEDYISALNPNEFIEMVNSIREVENFPDPHNYQFELTDREKTYRKNSKKMILADKDIPEGAIISESDVTMLRSAEEYNEILDQSDIIGKKALRKITKYQAIRKEFLQ
ncbi:MAG TPA: N-acetylneuraminate synthase family protein [Chitinophagaceae bacterium]|nr:N-acetylneuraminate synthase family protein [Chitinophagaceae bacterium]